MLRALIIAVLLLPLNALAQVTITGKVINQADNKAVANASVFLSNATIGNKTGADGAFTLTKVKAGQYNLVVSIVGFESYSQTISVGDKNIVLPAITIAPRNTALHEVKISAGTDRARDDYLRLFENEFLGTTPLAADCRILNPELLDFDFNNKTQTLKASSVDFLIIENRALGYKLKYLLTNFVLTNPGEDDKTIAYSGQVFFEEMDGTPDQQKAWKQKRQEVYEGSAQNFLRSAINNRLDKNGFRVLHLAANANRPPDSIIKVKIDQFTPLAKERPYRDSLNYWVKKSKLDKFTNDLAYPALTEKDIIQSIPGGRLYKLNYKGLPLYISYNKTHRFIRTSLGRMSDPNNRENTLVTFNGPYTLVDGNGTVTNPQSLSYDGAWLTARIAGLLPLDYDPAEKDVVIDTGGVIKNINVKLKAFTAVNTIEKAYLHFDKPYYAAGDTIYFKGYIAAGAQHTLSNLSGILYVELINTNNRISQLLKLPVNDGLAWGDFALPDTLKAGNYHVRAYTNWMRNAADYYFDKTIMIGNPGNGAARIKAVITQPTVPQPTAIETPAPTKIDVQFFPESGYLVTGVRSKVAFKAVDANGLGINIQGVVVDNDNNQIAQLTAQHLGMGIFFITPETGKTYTAKLTYANGIETSTALPGVNASGYVLSVYNNDAQNITVKIATNDATFQQDKNKDINLVVQSGGNIIYSAKAKLTEPVFVTEVAKNRFPSGIAQFTIFSANGEPLNERVILVQNPNQLNIALRTDKNSYAARGKVNLNILAKDKVGNPVNGAFSITVTDETKVPVDEQNETTILSSLLLTSDIKGYIEKPNYYFTNVNDKTRADLDLLMLTQGYRRFTWKQVMSDEHPVLAFQPEKAISITGTIKTKSGKPIPKGKISLASNTGGIFRDTVADDNGRFVFTNLAFADTMRFLVKGRKLNENDNVLVSVDNITSPVVNPATATIAVSNMDSYLQNSKMEYTALLNNGLIKGKNVLKVVNINSKKADPPLRHTDNLNTPGGYDALVRSDRLRLFNSLVGGLRGVPGLSFDQWGRAFVHAYGPMQRIPTAAMLIVIDGTPMVDDANTPFTLDDINVDDVASVEVLSSMSNTLIYGTKGRNGILLITTKQTPQDYIDGWGPPEDYTPGMVTYKTHGYYIARQFYAPNYDDPKTNTRVADLRTTIYWNPNIITDKDGHSTVSFFNADAPGIYKAVIEGIDADGNIGRQVLRYKVE